MTNRMKINKYLFLLVIMGSIFLYYRIYYLDALVEKQRFREQLGTYIIDLKKTDLGIYSSDSSLYKQLTLTFRDDATFLYNMQVPFIYDSVGKWNTGGSGVEEWNYLYYRNWNYSAYKKNHGDQFDQCCDSDSSFEINSVTPKKLHPPVSRITFKKIKGL